MSDRQKDKGMSDYDKRSGPRVHVACSYGIGKRQPVGKDKARPYSIPRKLNEKQA